jgi:hypothetical protein
VSATPPSTDQSGSQTWLPGPRARIGAGAIQERDCDRVDAGALFNVAPSQLIRFASAIDPVSVDSEFVYKRQFYRDQTDVNYLINNQYKDSLFEVLKSTIEAGSVDFVGLTLENLRVKRRKRAFCRKLCPCDPASSISLFRTRYSESNILLLNSLNMDPVLCHLYCYFNAR